MSATCDVSNNLRLGVFCDFGNFVMLLSWYWSKLAVVTRLAFGTYGHITYCHCTDRRQMKARDRYVVCQVLFVYILMRWNCAIFWISEY